MKIGRTLSLVLAAGSLTHGFSPEAARAAAFRPFYVDGAMTGFNDPAVVGTTTLGAQRKAAFEAALDVLRQSFSRAGDANVGIDIDAQFLTPPAIPAFAIAGAGPLGFTPNVAGGVGDRANTAYPWALENYILKNNPVRGSADITILFNTAQPFYYGTDGRPAAGTIDMVGTAVHELIHGLGFAPSFDQRATIGMPPVVNPDFGRKWGFGTPGNRQTVYDSFMRDNAGNQFTGVDALGAVRANPVAAAVTTTNVTWGGSNGKNANGQATANPSLFSPNPFQGGSSLAHLDEFEYWGAWEMMTPNAPARGEPQPHYLSPVVQGMLMDIGYADIKSLRKFWTSPSVSNNWSAATSWWDPQAPVAGSLPVAGERVILHQPRMDDPTGSVVTLDQNATVREVVNMNTLNVGGGNLTLTHEGLTNGGKVNVSNAMTITSTTIDNIKGGYLPSRTRRDGADAGPFTSTNRFASELTVSGANSKVVASDKVNNNAKITVSNQGRLTAAKRFSNYNEAGTTLDIASGGRVELGSVLSNGSAAKITIKDPNSRLIAKGDFTINDGVIEATAGGQMGLKSLINIGSLTVKNGSNVAGNQSRVSVDTYTSNHGTISIEGESPRPAHTPNFMGDRITNHGTFNLVTNAGVTYSKFENLGRTNFMGNAPRPAAARGLGDDYEGIAFGADMTNEGTGVLAGPGLMINSGDFINYSMMNTEWDTRSSTLAFIPGGAGEVSDLRTNSAEHDSASEGFAGGRIYAEHMAMEISLPTLPPVLSPVDEPMDAAARSTTGGIPSLDVFDGAIYLLDHPTNGLSQLLSNISAGLASIFDSTNLGRPVFDMESPDSIIRLIPGIPGAPIAGFYNNFALGSLEIYAGSSVTLQVPAPGVIALLLAPAALVLRRRRAGDVA